MDARRQGQRVLDGAFERSGPLAVALANVRLKAEAMSAMAPGGTSRTAAIAAVRPGHLAEH
jgi:hypothetical protein